MYSKIFRYNVLYAILYCSCIKYWLLQLIAYLLKLSMKIRQFWKLFKICTSVTLKSLNLQQMQSSEKNFLWINLTKRFYLQLFQREQKRRNNVQFFKAFDWTNMNSTITDFSPLSHFYTPWKRQKTISFQGVWKCDIGGIEMWHWTKIGQSHHYKFTFPIGNNENTQKANLRSWKKS